MNTKRYSRQIILKDFGQEGQQALANTSVLVIGAGGLGCPVLQYLVAMGVGFIGLADDDLVSMTNLHRQILFGADDIGKAKVKVAIEKLQLLNEEVKLIGIESKVDQNNAIEIISDYDIIVDCSDNFSTRYLINDVCVLLKKTLVYGAVSGYEGQVAVFNHKMNDEVYSNNYRDLYPIMPKEGEIQSCAEAGVLGVLPGIIGSLQASEVIKLIVGNGQVLTNKILCYNMLQQHVTTFDYHKQENYTGPKTIDDFLNNNYVLICDIPNKGWEIDIETLQKMLNNGNTICVDVRQDHELPKITKIPFKHIVLSELPNRFHEIEKANIVFICHSGIRSLTAVELAQEHFKQNRFYSLKRGVIGNAGL